MAARAAAACYYRSDGRWRTLMAPPPGSVMWSSLRLTPANLVASTVFYRAVIIFFTHVALLLIIAINGLSTLSELSSLFDAGPIVVTDRFGLFVIAYVPGLILILFYAVICW